jgi:hypothetical protein
LAAKYGNIQVAKLLLARQAPINAQGKVMNSFDSEMLQRFATDSNQIFAS